MFHNSQNKKKKAKLKYNFSDQLHLKITRQKCSANTGYCLPQLASSPSDAVAQNGL